MVSGSIEGVAVDQSGRAIRIAWQRTDAQGMVMNQRNIAIEARNTAGKEFFPMHHFGLLLWLCL